MTVNRGTGHRTSPLAGYANRPSGGQCESCGAPIRWEITAKNGRPIPLNTTPDERGSIVLRGNPPRAHTLSKTLGPADGESRFMPHHATCPHGRGWRRPRRD